MLLLLAHVSGMVSPAMAQSAWGQSVWDAPEEEQAVSSWGDPFGMEQPAEHGGSSGFSGGVPEWAAPRETPPGTWSPEVRHPSEGGRGYDIPRWGGESNQEVGTNMEPPGLPNTPNKVPIDGGLGLLLAAGAGYAVHRLRKKEDDTDTDDIDDDAPLP